MAQDVRACLAVLCVRNEEAHLRRALSDFTTQGIDVALIDHGSTDATRAICGDFLRKGLLTVASLEWTGEYDQTAQLEAKRDLAAKFDHDWILHVDADEWLFSNRRRESLRRGIARLDDEGYNAINFEEFVFLPPPGSTVRPRDCRREFRDYYFYAPRPYRLMRAWKRESGLTNVDSGGHVLSGHNLRVAPESFILKHYIVLSEADALAKYGSRRFAAHDCAKGWHANRLGMNAERLRIPAPSVLKRAESPLSIDLDRSDPHARHFWEWSLADRGLEPQSTRGRAASGQQ